MTIEERWALFCSSLGKEVTLRVDGKHISSRVVDVDADGKISAAARELAMAAFELGWEAGCDSDRMDCLAETARIQRLGGGE